MVLAAADPGRAQAGHDVRTDRANQPDEIAEHLVVPPLLERLLDAERVAEVDRSREVLLGGIEAMQRRQFLGAQHAERLEDLGADLVLAAIAACGGGQRRAIALSPVQHHEETVVFIVGMRGGHHEDARVPQVAQRQAEGCVPLDFVDRCDAHLR
ncbi:MAG: hypothetical protein QM736_23895 [Vicinamibacterales bacterium]